MADHKGLLPALLAVQSAAPTLPKDKTNPHFKSKYTPLDTIVETIGPLLAKHGLTWVACPTYGPDGHPALNYRLSHAQTNEGIEGTMPLLLSKPDAQGMGSAITYARRYSLCAVLNLVADEDDDGNGAGGKSTGQRQRGPAPAPANGKPADGPQTPSTPTLDDARATTLERMARTLVDGKVWTGRALKAQLVAAGARDTSSVGVAVRSLSAEQADMLEKAMEQAVA